MPQGKPVRFRTTALPAGDDLRDPNPGAGHGRTWHSAEVPARIRGRILALTLASPPDETGLSHWSNRQMAGYIKRTEDVVVSHKYVAKLWRDNGLRPHWQGTFKVRKDPAECRRSGCSSCFH